MKFTLNIDLDNAEVEDAGIDQVLPAYLGQVARRAASGNADRGIVRDGNGNVIGTYETTDSAPRVPFGFTLSAAS
jgi:hypothetical protein